ncbi:MAG: hypothetical protein WCZ66_01695 [Sphingomonadaceae bacterium]
MPGTLTGTFQTRRAAEMAVEHLVQEYGVQRAAIFIEPDSGENSSGEQPGGSDLKADTAGFRSAGEPALHGGIKVSVDMEDDRQATRIEQAFRDFEAGNLCRK